MELILTSVAEDLTVAWRRFCAPLPGVRIHEGSILDVSCDAVVSPANSFGFMDGGIDAVYLERFGDQLQGRVQRAIRERHGGELVVGAADVVETGDAAIPYLIIAPTMRVPMILRESVNPYLAARALLRLVLHGVFAEGEARGEEVRSRIRRIALPGLGTGVGQVSAAMCAHQVAQAIEDVVLGHGEFPRTWAEASERHQALFGGRPRRLQHERE